MRLESCCLILSAHIIIFEGGYNEFAIVLMGIVCGLVNFLGMDEGK